MRITAALVVLALFGLTPAWAATYTVVSTADGGPGSLREAILAANTSSGVADTIVFGAGVTGAIWLTSELAITDDLTITGPGPLSLAILATPSRVLFVSGGTTAHISGLTIGGINNDGTLTLTNSTVSNINFLGFGGGILNTGRLTLNDSLVVSNTAVTGGGIYNDKSGTLTVANSTVSSNTAYMDGSGISNEGTMTLTNSDVIGNSNEAAFGGGISNYGTLTLTDSTVRTNGANSSGGGIYNTHTLTLIRSTVSGNVAGDGGGIHHSRGILTLTNSTVSSNEAVGENHVTTGGGILNVNGTVRLSNSTVTNNTAGLGAGIHNYFFSMLHIKNTIVANNPGGNCAGTSDSTATSSGHNLSNDGSCTFFTGVGDLNGVSAGLGGLHFAGGPTQIHAFLGPSAAIDAIPSNDCVDLDGAPIATDQRGVARPQGPACDIGAYELVQVATNGPPFITLIDAPLDARAIGSPVTVAANFTDPDAGNTHTCSISWGDGSSAAGAVTEPSGAVQGTCSASHSYAAAGVYTVDVTVTDNNGASDTDTFEFVVIYDPSAGFVTGGGWINSPAGASAAFPSAVGKASFGFVSKYQRGATLPTGQTAFQFIAGDLDFHSTSYEWLVISGPMAQYKGSGTINGSGDYGFLLTATDSALAGGGAADTFRLKIWRKDTEGTVYDNGTNQAIGGGSIVIHRK